MEYRLFISWVDDTPGARAEKLLERWVRISTPLGELRAIEARKILGEHPVTVSRSALLRYNHHTRKAAVEGLLSNYGGKAGRFLNALADLLVPTERMPDESRQRPTLDIVSLRQLIE